MWYQEKGWRIAALEMQLYPAAQRIHSMVGSLQDQSLCKRNRKDYPDSEDTLLCHQPLMRINLRHMDQASSSNGMYGEVSWSMPAPYACALGQVSGQRWTGGKKPHKNGMTRSSASHRRPRGGLVRGIHPFMKRRETWLGEAVPGRCSLNMAIAAHRLTNVF